MANVLNVSRSGYYKFLNRKKSNRSLENEQLFREIKTIHKESRETYGSPRIHAELKANGYACSRKRVARIMKKERISAKTFKQFRKTTIYSKKKKNVFPNYLDQNFEVKLPNKVYASDITYVSTDEGWLYLSVTLDLFSRKVVGMSMEKKLDASLSVKSLSQALMRREKISDEENILHHSDRGVQYTCKKFQIMAKDNHISLRPYKFTSSRVISRNNPLFVRSFSFDIMKKIFFSSLFPLWKPI